MTDLFFFISFMIELVRMVGIDNFGGSKFS